MEPSVATASEACMAAKIVGKWCYVVYIGQNVHYRFSQKMDDIVFPISHEHS